MVTSAFVDDPVERWLYPGDDAYDREFPGFVHALGGKAVEERTAWCSKDNAAVALSLPPGITPDDDAISAVLTATVATSKHADMFAGLEQMSQAHPSEPHWYLAWLAVDRGNQGRWVLLHIVEEIARHAGHADFLHEAIDGAVGE